MGTIYCTYLLRPVIEQQAPGRRKCRPLRRSLAGDRFRQRGRSLRQLLAIEPLLPERLVPATCGVEVAWIWTALYTPYVRCQVASPAAARIRRARRATASSIIRPPTT